MVPERVTRVCARRSRVGLVVYHCERSYTEQKSGARTATLIYDFHFSLNFQMISRISDNKRTIHVGPLGRPVYNPSASTLTSLTCEDIPDRPALPPLFLGFKGHLTLKFVREEGEPGNEANSK